LSTASTAHSDWQLGRATSPLIALGTVALLPEGHALGGPPAGHHSKCRGHQAVLRVLDDFDDVVDRVVEARCGFRPIRSEDQVLEVTSYLVRPEPLEERGELLCTEQRDDCEPAGRV
jgi:hypothetical protein